MLYLKVVQVPISAVDIAPTFKDHVVTVDRAVSFVVARPRHRRLCNMLVMELCTVLVVLLIDLRLNDIGVDVAGVKSGF